MYATSIHFGRGSLTERTDCLGRCYATSQEGSSLLHFIGIWRESWTSHKSSEYARLITHRPGNSAIWDSCQNYDDIQSSISWNIMNYDILIFLLKNSHLTSLSLMPTFKPSVSTLEVVHLQFLSNLLLSKGL